MYSLTPVSTAGWILAASVLLAIGVVNMTKGSQPAAVPVPIGPEPSAPPAPAEEMAFGSGRRRKYRGTAKKQNKRK